MTNLQDKTPEELNVICAKLCGWKECSGKRRINCPCSRGYGWLHKPEWPGGKDLGPHSSAVPSPPYATSYDAIMPCVKALTDKQTFAFIEHLRVIRNIQATGDFAFTWLMMTSSEADLTRALILVLQSK